MRTDRKSHVKIGYRDYTISFKEMTNGLQGECDKTFFSNQEKGRITIKKGMDDIEKCNTMLHEIMHAIFTERGLIFSDKTEERIVLSMTNGLIDFIRDNPRFFKRWLKLMDGGK